MLLSIYLPNRSWFIGQSRPNSCARCLFRSKSNKVCLSRFPLLSDVPFDFCKLEYMLSCSASPGRMRPQPCPHLSFKPFRAHIYRILSFLIFTMLSSIFYLLSCPFLSYSILSSNPFIQSSSIFSYPFLSCLTYSYSLVYMQSTCRKPNDRNQASKPTLLACENLISRNRFINLRNAAACSIVTDPRKPR